MTPADDGAFPGTLIDNVLIDDVLIDNVLIDRKLFAHSTCSSPPEENPRGTGLAGRYEPQEGM